VTLARLLAETGEAHCINSPTLGDRQPTPWASRIRRPYSSRYTIERFRVPTLDWT